jgi:hypothetical protein
MRGEDATKKTPTDQSSARPMGATLKGAPQGEVNRRRTSPTGFSTTVSKKGSRREASLKLLVNHQAFSRGCGTIEHRQ